MLASKFPACRVQRVCSLETGPAAMTVELIKLLFFTSIVAVFASPALSQSTTSAPSEGISLIKARLLKAGFVTYQPSDDVDWLFVYL